MGYGSSEINTNFKGTMKKGVQYFLKYIYKLGYFWSGMDQQVSSNRLLNIQVSETSCIIKKRMLVYLSSMTLGDYGHCCGMGQLGIYPPISIADINTAPNLKPLSSDIPRGPVLQLPGT